MRNFSILKFVSEGLRNQGYHSIKSLNDLIFVFITINLFFIESVYCQNSFPCGVYSFPPPNNYDPDSIYFDRFGNIYPFNISSICANQVVVHNIGYFTLEYCDVPADMILNIDDVFTHISTVIGKRDWNHECSQQERVMISIDMNEPDPYLAAGSPMYEISPSNSGCTNTIIDRVYRKMNGGYAINDRTLPDGFIHINPLYPANDPDPMHRRWRIRPNNFNPIALDYDLYSVILHEVLHIFGFSSTITNANSIQNLTFYDRYLHVEDNSMQSGTVKYPVFQSNCIQNCWVLNPLITNLGNLILNTCISNKDIVFGSSSIAPILGGALNLGNAIVHLNPKCHGTNSPFNYLMAPLFDDNEIRDVITNPEKEILCALGYQVLSYCDPCYVVPYPDKGIHLKGNEYDQCCVLELNACVNEKLIILDQDLLCNDATNFQNPIITDLFLDPSRLPGASDIDIARVNGHWEVTMHSKTAYYLIYTITSCDCKQVNSELYISAGTCLNCTNIPPCENLFCSNGFSEFSDDYGRIINYALGGMWHYKNRDGNTPDFCRNNGQVYVQLYGGTSTLSLEAIAVPLQQTIEPGCYAKIKFKASSGTLPSQLSIYASEFYPCYPLESEINIGQVPTNCGNRIYNPFLIQTVDITNITVKPGQACVINPNFQEYILTPYLNNSIPINYIVFTTVPNDLWILLDDIVITQDCFDADFSFSVDCRDVVFTPDPNNNNYTYNWQFGDGLTGTTRNPSHHYLNNGNFVVTLTITDQCNNSKVISHNVLIDCIDDPFCDKCQSSQLRINFTNPSKTKVSEYGINSIPAGACITIAGKLEIDVNNIQFDNNNVWMEPGAEIYLNPGLSLSSINSTFRGCSQMWKSITIPNGSSFNCESSFIYDARKGIHSIGNTTLNLLDNHFYNDEVGIYAEGGIVNSPFFMEENVFESISPGFLPNYGGAPTPGIGKSGIETLNATWHIGSDYDGGPVNYFINLRNGIYVTSSNISIFNAQFIDMIPFPPGAGFIPSGIAIFGQNSYITANRNYIDYADAGIYLFDSKSATTNFNEIYHVRLGISEWRGNRKIIANNNKISYTLQGIGIQNPNKVTNLEIEGNDPLINIGNSANYATGIYINGLKKTFTSKIKYAKIKDNLIFHPKDGEGIRLVGCEYVALQHNIFNNTDIDQVIDYDYAGFSLDNVSNCVIYNNYVFGKESSTSANTYSFEINGSSNNTYCLNYSTESRYGFNFSGTCTSKDRFRSNVILNHSRGLNIKSSSVLGTQEYTGNNWNGTYIFDAAANAETQKPVRLLSQFTINTCNPPQWPLSITPIQGCVNDPELWIRLNSQGFNNTICTAPFPTLENPLPPDGGILTNNDEWTAQGIVGTYSPLVFEMPLDLYTKLKSNPNLLGNNSQIDSFYASNSNTNLYKFYRLDSAINEFLTLKGNHYEMIFALDSIISDIQNSIRQLDILFNAANTELERTNIAAQKYNLILQQLSLINESDSLLTVISTEKSNLLLSIQTWDSEIIPIGVVEQNRHTANEVFIATILHGIDTLNSVQLSQLEPIANQCFLSGGRGVLIARELMRMVSSYQYIDDLLCSPPQPIFAAVDDSPRSDFIIRPNPSNGNFVVHCPVDQKGNINSIILTDLEGHQVLNQKVQVNNELQIELKLNNSIPPGIYLIQICNHKKKLYSDKIIIID